MAYGGYGMITVILLLAMAANFAEDRTAPRGKTSPSPFVEAEFTALDERRGKAAVAWLIQQSWRESCVPAEVAPSTRSPDDDSMTWSVRCAGRDLRTDYVVNLPVKTHKLSAGVLKCFSGMDEKALCTPWGPEPS